MDDFMKKTWLKKLQEAAKSKIWQILLDSKIQQFYICTFILDAFIHNIIPTVTIMVQLAVYY